MGCSALLASLSASSGTLEPAFAPEVFEYDMHVGLLQSHVTLSLEAPSGVRIEINGAEVAPGTPWTSAALTSGQLMVEIKLTSASGQSTRYTVNVERSFKQEAYIKAGTVDVEDGFGSDVAIAGDTLVVGALNEDSRGGDPSDDSAADSGAAYVYVRKGDAWTQQAFLKPDASAAGDLFGSSVAISGDTIAVGAPRSRAYGSMSGNPPGVVYLFVRDAMGAWTQQARVTSSTTAPDLFGFSVALRGDRLVVGAPYDGEGAQLSGALYVFERAGGTWSASTKLKAQAPATEGILGWSVAFDGDTIVGGAPGDSQIMPGEGGEGSAYVYVKGASGWTQQALLTPPQRVAGDIFGFDVAVSADMVVVGAPGSAEFRVAPDGHAYVFERTGAQWNITATLQASSPRDNDAFGTGVAVSNDVLVISASADGSAGQGLDAGASGSGSNGVGALYVYGRQAGTWVRVAFLKASNADDKDFFGEHLAIDGQTVVAGAIWESSRSTGVNGDGADNSVSHSGAAYVFR
jgi:hypothetical protein